MENSYVQLRAGCGWPSVFLGRGSQSIFPKEEFCIFKAFTVLEKAALFLSEFSEGHLIKRVSVCRSQCMFLFL